MSIAIVQSISGQAWARDASGNLRELRVGDALQEGETVVTSNGGDVQLDFGDNLDPTLIEGGEQVVMTQELGADQTVDASEFAALDEDLEALLAALDDESIDLLDVLDATAAGAGPGGAADGGHSFVRLARIAEDVDPLIFNFGLNDLGGPPEEQGGAFLLAETEVEEPEVPVVIAPTAESFDATLLDIETLNEPGSVASGVLPFTFGSGSGGTVTFAAMDGVVLQVGGETLTFSWNAGTSTLQAVSEARGVTIFSIEINPSTGAFTVTQVNSLLHGEGMEEALASLVYTVSSTSGSATGTLQLTFVDDAPLALDDTASTGEDTPITVNVMANDTAGADGATLTAVSLRNPSQGTLSFAANGQVTFTPAPGFEGDAVIDYTITDADGDTASATLTVTVAPDSVPVIAISADSDSVAEAGLPNGSAAGDGSHVTSGTFNFDTGNDGLASLVINGVNVTAGGTVTGSHGSLVVTPGAGGSYGWTYTLSGPTSGDTTSDSFTLVVTDSDGDEASDSLVIDIVDDVPQAVDDTASQAEENAPVTIDVFANDTGGADGVDLTSGVAPVANSLTGTGTLAYNADGTFTYTPAAGEEGVVSFEYTITDADGDTSTATVTLTLKDDSEPTIEIGGPNVEDGRASVDEAGLPNGSAAGDGSHVTSGTFNIDTGNDGLASLVINGVNVAAGGTVQGTHGALVVTLVDGSYSWTYTLDGATDGDTTSDSFTLVVTDSDGSNASDSLVIDIVDDVPQAVNDNGGTVTEDSAVTVLSGSVLANDALGADGFGSLTWDVSAEDLADIGQYGSLVLNVDGSWSFTLDNSLAAVQALTASDLLNFELGYTVTDADGDTASATLSLSIKGADDSAEVIVSAEGADSTVYEAGLTSEADTRESASGSFQVSATDGIASVTVGGQSFTLAHLQGFTAASPSVGIVTSMGTLYLTGYSGTAAAGTVSYTYTLSEAQAHGASGSSSDYSLTDSVSLSVTGVGGSTAEATLTVDIIDDTPSLTSLNLAIGNVAGTYDGIYEFDVGADAQGFLDSFGEGSLVWTGMPSGYELIITGSSDTSITYTAQSGSFEFFNLTLHANGTYSFELVSPAPVVETEVESLLSAFDASNFFKEDGKTAYLFTADVFDGKFAMAVKAYRNGKLEDVNMSATDLGVKSNVVQGQQNEILRFDVRPIEGQGAIGVSTFTFSVSGTAGSSAGDKAKLTVFDVNGATTVYYATLASGDGEFVFNIDPTLNVDYMELAPAGSNSFKIDGVSTSYVTQIYPDDYQLDFELSGSDADGDVATVAFTVSVKTTEDGTYEITGTDGDDVVHGTEGGDILSGGAGHDTLIGDDGDDIFQWNLGDQGGSDAPAIDTIKDFGFGEDVLDLADLLQNEGVETIDSFIVAAQQGSDTVLYINHEGGINVDGSNATQVIVLENYSMGEVSSADFLQEMLENGQLHIDQ